ncbi:MAG: hypothetical protein RR212_12985 [Bacteroidales bacterium]
MLHRIFFSTFLIFVCNSIYCANPFKKEHHFQVGVKLPFEFSTYSNDDWHITMNGIPVPVPEKDRALKQKTHKSPTLYAGYLFMPKKWVAFGASFSWRKEHGNRNYFLFPSLNHQYTQQCLALKADVKFFWLNKKYVDLYSSFSLGVAYDITKREWEEYNNKKHEFMTAIDFSLIGLTVGNRVYGLFEWQGIFSGLKMGVGYKF